MKSAKWPVNSLFLVCLLLAGCASTRTPEIVPVARAASYDGNAQNSGIYEVTPAGFVVSDLFLARYDDLIKCYGSKFSPPIKKRQGVTGNLIDREHMERFLVMNSWRRSGFTF